MLFRVIFIVGLFSTIFVWWPYSYVSFEIPKVISFGIFVKILFLHLMFNVGRDPQSFKKWKLDVRILSIIAILLIWINISAILGIDVQKSYFGNYYRRDGLFTFFDLIGFSLVLSYFWKSNYRKLFSGTIFISAITLSVLYVLERTIIPQIGQISATFGNVVFLAGFLSVSLPFNYYFLKTSNNKILYFLILPVIMAVILSGVISAILTLLLFTGLYIAFLYKNKYKKILLTLTFLLAFLLLSSWIINYLKTNSRVLIAEGRVRIFLNIVEGVFQRPIFGYGWANTDYAFESGNWPIKLNDDVYIDKAHSHLLEYLAVSGIPGLLIYVALLWSLFLKLLKRYFKDKSSVWNFSLLTVFILFVFHSQTNVISIAEEMLFWHVLGLNLLNLEEI